MFENEKKNNPVGWLPLAAALLIALPAASQNYPVRPVRLIVPFAAGGNTDITARAIGTKLFEVFGQQIVVENRPGGATNIGSELVAKAPPDGYTILMGGTQGEFVRFIRAEIDKYAKDVKATGMKPQ